MLNEMKEIINEKKNLKNKHFIDFPEENIREEMDIIMNVKENIEKVNDVLQGDCYPRKGKVLEIKEFFNLFMKCDNRNLNKNIITIDEMYGKENNIFPKKEGITPNNIHKHYNFLYFLKEEYLEIYDEESVLTPYVRALELIKHLYFNAEDLKSFIFYICDDEIEIMNKNIKTRILKILCFDPGFGFNKIIKETPHNIILTSGTLSPIDGLEFSLKTPIPIQLENKHIIDKSHSKFEIIKSEKLNNTIIKYQFDYSNRSNLNMIKSLGNIILNYVKSLNKGGILIFFPSFNFLSQCYSIWVSDKIIEKISKIKKVYYDNKMNKNLIHDFMINKEKNSIIFSVVRGNISEGLDFKDDFARIVICIGIPYANFYEERIQLKMKFLDGFFNKNQNLKINKMSGRDWYKIDAIQTVNQSLGRVLRHKDDYGMMICIDLRFEYQYIFKLFSKWMKDICDIISIDNMNYFSNIKKYFDKLEIENRNDIKKKVIEYESESVKKEKFLEYFNMNNNKKNKKDSIDNKLDFFIKGDFNLNNNINDNLGLNNKKIGKKKNVNLNKTNNLNYENIEMNNIKDGKIKNSNLNNKDIIPFINYKDLNIEKNKKRKAPYIYNEKSTIENLVKKKGVDEIMHSNISVTKMDFSKISTPKKLSSEKTKFTSISKEICESNTEIKENISLNLINYALDNSYNDFLQNFISNRENNSKTLKNLEINTEEELKKINKNENNNEIVNIKEEILNNNTNFIEINDDFNCPICLKNVKENPEIVFSISKCKHIICEECWTKCLEIKMECPICKKKVREKTLKKILRK
jgi:regulator of telomere elongation helicase 1